jgi:outer membrane receptor for ferrienterochelin and colicins
MIKLVKISFALIFIISSFSFAQQRPDVKKISITGIILEKGTNLPLEYATVIFQNAENPEILTGGITDLDGKFNFEVNSGTYNVRFEFISFKTVELKSKKITSDTNLGITYLEGDISQLKVIDVVAEKSTVEIKLDKRVYNVGKDMMVKGGTISDVLDNVPSVTVDPDGTIALRGNENVRILIDGKPSGLAGINIADALKLLPADAVEKVEVITNPSARYDAEGSGGIINIVLRKGKAEGVNGSVILSTGNPESYGASTSLNLRSEQFNLFSNFGYNYRTSPGNSLNNSKYLNSDGTTSSYIYENRNNDRVSEGYNANFGIDLFVTKTATWSNAITFNESNGKNPDNVYFNNYDAAFSPTFTRNRLNDGKSDDFNFEYATNFTKNFKKEDEKLTIDIAISQNRDNDESIIYDQILGDVSSLFTESTLNKQKQQRNLFQADYVLPIGQSGRFEAGYRGSFQKNLTDFQIEPNTLYSNLLEYNENINAFYLQYGNKINKFSYFLGLRFEDNDIDVNSLSAQNYNTKKYNNFFPTATFNYEFSESSNVSLSYSKRINRPRGRFLNPFSTYSSNINIFQGNPDLNPAYTNAFDLGYLKKWKKLTLNTSIYFNATDASFQFIRKESGLFVTSVIDGEDIVDPITGNVTPVGGEDQKIPVIVSTPINLSKEYRAGFEFNVNYTPYKWWKLNGNLNVFRNENQGDYKYTNYLGDDVVQNFDNIATSWFTRISSKISLPYKIDWQTNATYNGAQKTAQGKRLDMTSVNLSFSKDVLKDKGTIALNASDLFNTRKRRFTNEIPNVVSSYSEFQWRQRQITLSFTYRFNKKKNDREGQRREDGEGGGEFM